MFYEDKNLMLIENCGFRESNNQIYRSMWKFVPTLTICHFENPVKLVMRFLKNINLLLIYNINLI